MVEAVLLDKEKFPWISGRISNRSQRGRRQPEAMP